MPKVTRIVLEPIVEPTVDRERIREVVEEYLRSNPKSRKIEYTEEEAKQLLKSAPVLHPKR